MAIQTKVARRPGQRTLVYGPPGVGKTHLLAETGAVFVQVEEGLDGVPFNVPADSQPHTFDEMLEQIDAAFAYAKSHGLGRVALDSFSGMEKLIHKRVCADAGVEHMEGEGYSKLWRATYAFHARVQERIDRLRTSTGVSFWMSGHSLELQETKPETGQQYKRLSLQVQGDQNIARDVRSSWIAFLDNVFALTREVDIVSKKGLRPVAKRQGRSLWCGPDLGHVVSKNRCALPDKIEEDDNGSLWVPLRAAMLEGFRSIDAARGKVDAKPEPAPAPAPAPQVAAAPQQEPPPPAKPVASEAEISLDEPAKPTQMPGSSASAEDWIAFLTAASPEFVSNNATEIRRRLAEAKASFGEAVHAVAQAYGRRVAEASVPT